MNKQIRSYKEITETNYKTFYDMFIDLCNSKDVLKLNNNEEEIGNIKDALYYFYNLDVLNMPMRNNKETVKNMARVMFEYKHMSDSFKSSINNSDNYNFKIALINESKLEDICNEFSRSVMLYNCQYSDELTELVENYKNNKLKEIIVKKVFTLVKTKIDKMKESNKFFKTNDTELFNFDIEYRKAKSKTLVLEYHSENFYDFVKKFINMFLDKIVLKVDLNKVMQ